MGRGIEIIQKSNRAIAIAAAWSTACLGLFFCFAWQAGLYFLLFWANWPLPYSTSLCLFFSGLSFLSLIYYPKTNLYRWLAIPVLIIAGLRLVEFAFHIDLHISSLLLKTLLFKTPLEFPPMKLVGAINCTLLSFIFLSWPQKTRPPFLSVISIFFCLIIALSSIEAIIIHFLPLEGIYLMQLIPIHLFASINLLALAVGLIFWNLYLDSLHKIDISKWTPILTAFTTTIFNLFLIITLLLGKQLFITESVESKSIAIEKDITLRFNLLTNFLQRLTGRIEASQNTNSAWLLSDTNTFLRQNPLIEEIGWTNAELEVIQLFSPDGKTHPPFPIPIQLQEVKSCETVSSFQLSNASHSLYLCCPFFWDNLLQGVLFFKINLTDFLSEIRDTIGIDGYSVEININGKEEYQYGNGLKGSYGNHEIIREFSLSNLQFSVDIAPHFSLPINALSSILLTVISIGGLIGSILAGWVVHLFQLSRQKNLYLEKTSRELKFANHILEAINESDTISQASEKSLQFIHELYGWEVFAYCEMNRDQNSLQLSQFVTLPPIDADQLKSTLRNPSLLEQGLAAYVFRSGKPFFCKDIGKEKWAEAKTAKANCLQGALAIPIYRHKKAIGAIQLLQRAPLSTEPDLAWISFMQNIGSQFSIFVERREKEVLKNELTAIFTSSFDAIYILNLEYQIQRWNQAAERLYGWKESEIAGKSVLELYPKERLKELENLKKFVFAKSTGFHLETQRVRKDGKVIWVDLSYSPIYDEQGNIKAISVISKDIADKIQLEISKNEFISMVAHELRSPLTSVIGAVELLLKSGKSPSECQDLLLLASRNATHLAQLINDIIDVETIQLGKFEMKLEPFFLAEAIHEAVEISKPTAMKTKIELKEGDILPEIKILGDRHRVEQVLLNLISNAIKFSPPGTTVIVRMEQKEQTIRTSVIDQGMGVPKEFQSRLFDKFTQAQGGNTKTKGTGLGLNISKSIIEQLGGSIGFVSEPNAGSTFYFDFPIIK